MAFGKERENLQSVTPFGANTSMAQRTQFMMRNQGEQRQRRGGGGQRYSDIYKPTLSQAGFDLVRLIPGHYSFQGCDGKRNVYEYTNMEYWPYIEHYDGRNERSTICSGGVFHNFRDARDPCIGCDLFFSTMEKSKDANGYRKSRVSKTDKYVFNVLHFNPYHKIPQMNTKTGQVSTNDKGEPYFEWVPCEGRGCPICPQKVETTEARMLKWEMSFTHFKALTIAYASAIAQGCTNCRSKNSIQSMAWVCPFDGCGEAVIDLSDTTLKDEEIANITGGVVTCPHCKNTGFLNEVFQCSQCGSASRCTIFDVNMHVKRVSAGKENSKQTSLIVSDWSESCGIDPRFTEIAKPFELPKIYGPSTIEFQQKQFGEGGPAEGQAAQPQAGLTRTPVTAGAPNAGFRAYAGGAGAGPSGGPNYGR